MRAKISHNELYLRPFGVFENDLEIDFEHTVQPLIITQILECCTRDKNGDTLDQTFFWVLTIGERIEYLLTIATLGCSSDLVVCLPCLNKVCKEQMEIEISLESLLDLQQKTYSKDRFMVLIGDERIQMRRPTGNDQLEWLKCSFADKDEAIKAMLKSLISKPGSFMQEYSISDEWLKNIDSMMDEYDPLVNFNLSVCCPYCEKQDNYEINLEELSLQMLHKAQLRLLEDVHRFAIHYHWCEQQTFSVPPWRRAYYLDLIGKVEQR